MEACLASDPSLDQLFAVLADARRRHVLALTAGRPGRIDFDHLARSIAAIEGEGGSTEPSTESIRSVALSLYHVHLPKLSAAGVVEYDADAGTVSRDPLPERVESIVTAAAGTGREVERE